MKKIFGLSVLIFIIYFVIEIVFIYLGNGHTVEYQVKDNDKKFTVNEVFKSNAKKDANSYSISIKNDTVQFSLLTYQNFKRSSEIVKKIKYFEDNTYKCIFIKYRDNKVLNDVLCNDGTYNIPYHNITNPSEELKKFVESLKEYGYDETKWIDNTSVNKEKYNAILYIDNLIKSHFVGLVNDSNLFRINNIDYVANTLLFEGDTIKGVGFTKDKYITLDYTSAPITYNVYSFTSSKNFKISAQQDLKNAKVLGYYDDSIFIYDEATGKEYEIDGEKLTLQEVGDNQKTIKYYSDGWKYSNINDININNLNFGNEYVDDYNNPNFIKTIKRGHESGYYYYINNVNGRYNVYKSNINNLNNITYILSTTDINSIRFIGNYVYYLDGDYIRYYSDSCGNRTLFYKAGLHKDYRYNIFIDKNKEV
ncbi:MAG TPA: hypothetical protein PLV83_00040 [Bacilli bacterium]|nr:hypothetical protein [Bacilli bacterium]